MSITEAQFQSQTTLSAADKVRIVSEGASRNISAPDLADALVPLQTVASTEKRWVKASANYNVLAEDDIVLVDTVGVNLIVTLPNPLTLGLPADGTSEYTIKKIDNDNTTITVQSAGIATIDGFTEATLLGPDRPFLNVITDGADYHVTGG